jgi:hypothetical protein
MLAQATMLPHTRAHAITLYFLCYNISIPVLLLLVSTQIEKGVGTALALFAEWYIACRPSRCVG